MAERPHELFDSVDWRHIRDLMSRYPQKRESLNRLLDEMHAYEQAVFAHERGQIVTVPERPNTTKVLGAMIGSANEQQFSREQMPEPWQMTVAQLDALHESGDRGDTATHRYATFRGMPPAYGKPGHMIQVFRGISDNDPSTEIKPGDWCSASRDFASDGGRVSRVIHGHIDASHLIDVGTGHARGDTLIHTPPHEHLVKSAIEAGHAVPPHVLAEYPHLQPKPAAKPEQQFSQSTSPPSENGQSSEGLAYLLSHVESRKYVGPEKHSGIPENGVSRHVSGNGSHRYVMHVNGEPVSAVQVVSREKGVGQVANAYTHPDYRRQGHARALLQHAANDFPTLTHSDHLSGDGAAWRNAVAPQSFSRSLDDIGPVEFSADARTASERLAAMPPEENPPHTMTLTEYAARHGEDPSRVKEGWRARVANAISRGLDVAPHIQAEYEAGIPSHLRPQPPKQYPDPLKHPPAFSVVPDDESIESSDKDDGFYYHVIPKKHVKSVLKHGVHPNPAEQAMDEGWYRQWSRGKAFVSDRAGVPFWKNTIENHLESQGKKANLAVVRIPKHRVGPLEPDEAGTRDSRQNSYYATTPIVPLKPTPQQPPAPQSFSRELADIEPMEFSEWSAAGDVPDGPDSETSDLHSRLAEIAGSSASRKQKVDAIFRHIQHSPKQHVLLLLDHSSGPVREAAHSVAKAAYPTEMFHRSLASAAANEKASQEASRKIGSQFDAAHSRLVASGYEMEHQSGGSRYYRHPDGRRLRVADHYVPLTAERDYNVSGGGFSWANSGSQIILPSHDLDAELSGHTRLPEQD